MGVEVLVDGIYEGLDSNKGGKIVYIYSRVLLQSSSQLSTVKGIVLKEGEGGWGEASLSYKQRKTHQTANRKKKKTLSTHSSGNKPSTLPLPTQQPPRQSATHSRPTPTTSPRAVRRPSVSARRS